MPRLAIGRRDGKHKYHSLADSHVAELVLNSLSHAAEDESWVIGGRRVRAIRRFKMSDHKTHDQHFHAHGSGCGHTAVKQEGHLDYLHDGIFTATIKDTWMNTCWPKAAQINPTGRPLMHAVSMIRNVLTGLDVDTNRFRMAAAPITWLKGICIMRTRGTATTTAPLRRPELFTRFGLDEVWRGSDNGGRAVGRVRVADAA
jgi:hypothetical protein